MSVLSYVSCAGVHAMHKLKNHVCPTFDHSNCMKNKQLLYMSQFKSEESKINIIYKDSDETVYCAVAVVLSADNIHNTCNACLSCSRQIMPKWIVKRSDLPKTIPIDSLTPWVESAIWATSSSSSRVCQLYYVVQSALCTWVLPSSFTGHASSIASMCNARHTCIAWLVM